MSTPTVRKAVIPIAGWGTRMYPATKCVAKALFPIVDLDGFCKPIIQVVIEQALSALGPDGQVCIVVQHGQQDYFNTPSRDVYHQKKELIPVIEKLQDIGKRLHFALQEKQEGFGHAVLCAKDFVGNEPCLVLLGDHVYISHCDLTPAQQLVDSYNTNGKSITSADICKETDLGLNGILSGVSIGPALYDVTKIAEKPTVDYAREQLKCEGLSEGEYMCFFGIDLLTPRVFEILQFNLDNSIRTKGEIQLRDAMAQIAKEEGMLALRVSASRHDTGNPTEYAESVEAFNKARKKYVQ